MHLVSYIYGKKNPHQELEKTPPTTDKHLKLRENDSTPVDKDALGSYKGGLWLGGFKGQKQELMAMQ